MCIRIYMYKNNVWKNTCHMDAFVNIHDGFWGLNWYNESPAATRRHTIWPHMARPIFSSVRSVQCWHCFKHLGYTTFDVRCVVTINGPDGFQVFFPIEFTTSTECSAGSAYAVNCLSGWWFQTFFNFHSIWDNPSHWLSYFSRWLVKSPPTRINMMEVS